MNLPGISKLKEARIEALVLRAVPCAAHAPEAVPGCPDCLTGEQAYALGIKQKVEDLGVISETKGGPNGG